MRLKYLPVDAALWRAQQADGVVPQQQEGQPNEDGQIKTNDPETIRRTLREWGVIGG